jgi:aldehyde dehydrogenase (NAD+)
MAQIARHQVYHPGADRFRDQFKFELMTDPSWSVIKVNAPKELQMNTYNPVPSREHTAPAFLTRGEYGLFIRAVSDQVEQGTSAHGRLCRRICGGCMCNLIGDRSNGQFEPAASGRSFETKDPSTGAVLGRLAEGNAQDVDRAVHAARAAFQGPWSGWTPYERQVLLYRAYEVIDKKFEELAQIETMDMGAPVSRTRATKASLLKMILFFAGQTASIAGETLQNGLPGDVRTMSLKAPVGVVGGIIPWNGPLNSQWWLLGAVLATGCTTVLKPAENASLSVLRMAEILHEVGVPAGVINVVTGPGSIAGEALARHPDVDRIAFTGSTATGRKIIEASTVNIKKLQLELGGKSPDIIFADADLDKAVPGAAMGVFANSGQICFAGTRVFVQRSIVNEFCARVADFAASIKVGRSLDPDTQLGPLISDDQLERVLSYVQVGKEEGARLICGGQRIGGTLADGYFVAPTVFADVDNSMRIAQEEIFGPVLSVTGVSSPADL